MTDEKDKANSTVDTTSDATNDSSSANAGATGVSERDPWTDNQQVNQNNTKENAKGDNVTADSANTATVSQAQSGDADRPAVNAGSFEQDVLNRLAFAAVNEQRRTRRWGIFFKSAMLLYAIGLLYLYLPGDGGDISIGSHTALVEISGPIADDAFANANSIIGGLRAAYKDKNTKGVILRVNSPGGSPVQAGYINDEIYRLKEKHPDIPIKVVITDICASAAYYIAVAADDIYANKASIVGSIGVLMDGYGFVDTMKKLGVERRLMTAGDHKGFLDPFTPIKPDDRAHMQGLLNNIHDQFIAVVKKGRGDRLLDHPKMFSGLVWTGEKSMDLGLIDGLGSVGYVAREIIGQEKIVDYTPRPNYLDRFAEKIGVSAASSFRTMFEQLSIK
ncbi:MAG: S49 family peptidase [Gammaproteobacteria bacterium]|nr:S49 family peptidase [Gammaproteobacteria bacterium]